MIKKVFSALLLLVMSLPLFAQQGEVFSVVDFTEKPFDTAATDERYRLVDGNGELFSIIKLVSNTAGDNMRAYSFDFGLCESRVKEIDGEVWVYVQRNAMRAKIRREGYNTVTYELPVTVQPGRVYEMVLQAAPKVIKKRYVIFKVQPAGSKALILLRADSEKEYRPFGAGQVNEEGMLSDKLVLGRYFYKITSQNYHPSEGIIELTDGREAFSETVTLRSNLARVTLDVDKDTEIFIDGESKGFGPWSGELAPGPYNVECRKENHMNSIESIEVRGGETMEFALKSPVPITGALDIMSNPLEATVTIDGKEYGKTPAVIDGIIIGAHKVTLSKSGYSTVTLDVEIKEGKVAEKSLTLKKLPAKDQAAKDKKAVARKGDQAAKDKKAVASKGDQAAKDKKAVASKGDQAAKDKKAVASKSDQAANDKKMVASKDNQVANDKKAVASKGDQAAKDKKAVASKGDQAAKDKKAVASKGDQAANDKKTAASNSGQVARTTTLSGGTINGHEYVDLGLSVKWATCNVGATKPEEYGAYYAWGETEEKSCYDWDTYIYCNGSENTMVKYCIDNAYGEFDKKITLDQKDDVAHVKWGGGWRIPTEADETELRKRCTWEWITLNGVNGYKVTSTINGNSIFLPAAGCRVGLDVDNSGLCGYYWSNSLRRDYCSYAYLLFFCNGNYNSHNYYRCSGRSVRPVCE